MSPADEGSLSSDRIIEEMNRFMKYNMFRISLILLPTFMNGIYTSAYIFVAADIDYRCQVPECEDLNSTEWIKWAIPSDARGSEKCLRYSSAFTNASWELDKNICSAEWFDNTSSIKCDQFVYGSEGTIVKDFDLGCKEWKRTLVGTIHNSGSLVSIVLTGILSDHFGRKICLIMSSTVHGLIGLSRSFVTGYEVYLVSELLETLLGGGMFSSAFILIIESVPPKRRILVSTLMNVTYTTGLIVLAGLQWALQDWRMVLRVAFTPPILIIFYFFILDESVRWLTAKGRIEEAKKIIKKAAKFSNLVISDKLLSELDETVCNEDSSPKITDRHTIKLREVLKSTIIMKRLMSCTLLWISVLFTDYGMTIYSVSLSGNKYINYMLVCLVEIPSHVICIFVIDQFGRTRTMITTFTVGGLCCVIIALIPKDTVAIPFLLYLLGKFCFSLAFDCIYVYTSEIFPTPLRQTLFSVCSTVGRIGALLAPQVPLLGYYMESLPNILFGSVAVLSGIVACAMPETTNKKLPDTIEEAENLGKKNINI